MPKKERVMKTDAGVPVYLYPNEALHSFCLSLYLRAGSLYEDEKESGATHFIEHLLFRSVKQYMRGALYPTLDRLGLCFEGVTYREFMQLSITGAPQHFAEAARILCHTLRPLLLTEEDVQTERARIKAEIREESERTTLDYFTDRTLFGDSPLSRSITGTAGSISRMSRRYLCEKKDALFTAENLFFYMTGCVGEQEFCALSDALKGISLPKGERRALLAPRPDAFLHRNATVAVKSSDSTVLRLTFDIDTPRYGDAELSLLYDLLFGDGEECLLHRTLSEETGMIYSFRGMMENYRNMGVMGVTYEIAPSKLLPSLSLVLGMLGRVKSGKDVTLDFVRAPYTDNAAFLLDDPATFNWSRAYESKILGLPYEGISDRAKAYASVSEERIVQMANEIFTPDAATLTVKGRRVDTDALRALLLKL